LQVCKKIGAKKGITAEDAEGAEGGEVVKMAFSNNISLRLLLPSATLGDLRG